MSVIKYMKNTKQELGPPEERGSKPGIPSKHSFMFELKKLVVKRVKWVL